MNLSVGIQFWRTWPVERFCSYLVTVVLESQHPKGHMQVLAHSSLLRQDSSDSPSSWQWLSSYVASSSSSCARARPGGWESCKHPLCGSSNTVLCRSQSRRERSSPQCSSFSLHTMFWGGWFMWVEISSPRFPGGSGEVGWTDGLWKYWWGRL